MSKRPHVCIDRILPRDIHRFRRSVPVTPAGQLRALFLIGRLWMNGSTLRVRFLGGSEAQKKKTKEQAAWWTQHANLKFVFDDSPQAEIRIAFNRKDGAWSYVGTDAKSIPLDQPTMNLGFMTGGTAAHEFGHAIGLVHEHQNPKGGIKWKEAVVIKNLSGPPNYWTEEEIRHNVLTKYRDDQANGTEFDPESIMLYFFPPEWTLNGVGTKENEELSQLDKSFVASAAMYPKTKSGVNGKVPVLKVGAGNWKKASIGKPAEEDLFRFNVAKGGRHIVETKGKTNVVMKLFGPDSKTSLISEDDDSGTGSNARSIVDLIPGEYFVQIRHWNFEKGKGNYEVGVRKE